MDSIHYEVESEPEPTVGGIGGKYHVVKMRGNDRLYTVATFYGSDRPRAYSTARMLQAEMQAWRAEQE